MRRLKLIDGVGHLQGPTDLVEAEVMRAHAASSAESGMLLEVELEGLSLDELHSLLASLPPGDAAAALASWIGTAQQTLHEAAEVITDEHHTEPFQSRFAHGRLRTQRTSLPVATRRARLTN